MLARPEISKEPDEALYWAHMITPLPTYPMRINRYLASKKYCTRREADALIEKGKALINGKPAKLGDKVQEGDSVKILFRQKKHRYYAYHKPRGIITHSPQRNEEDIAMITPLKGVFPLGRLDKDSYGLMILTDDGRLTDALLNPDNAHEKEYLVVCSTALPTNLKAKMERGVDIGGYTTKPCTVRILGEKKFSIILIEGKKHQIRRMCGFFGLHAIELKRTRIMNIQMGALRAGEHREIRGTELQEFLASVGL